MDNLLFLEALSNSGDFNLREKADDLLGLHHPNRPSQQLAEWIDRITNITVDGDALSEYYIEGFMSFGFHTQIIDQSISRVVAKVDSNSLLSLVESIEEKDKSLGLPMKISVLRYFVKNNDIKNVKSYMDNWCISVKSLVHEIGTSSDPISILDFLAKNGNLREVLNELGWSERRTIFFKKHGTDKAYKLIVNILEYEGLFGDAYRVCGELLSMVASGKYSNIQDIAQMTLRVAEKAYNAKNVESPIVFMAPLVNPLTNLLGNPLENSWSFSMLERLHQKGYVDPEKYVDACLNLMNSHHSVINSQLRENMMGMFSHTGHHKMVLRIMENHLSYCPSSPSQAAGYYGNAGWYAYLAGDDKQFFELTEKALDFVTKSDYRKDWLLANRAFAYAICGNDSEALCSYNQVRKHVQDKKRWEKCVMEDLHKHSERRPDSPAINLAFIEEVSHISDDFSEATVKST